MLFYFLFLLSGCLESSNDSDFDFAFTMLTGEEKHLSDYFGKVIVIDFMGANCQPCFYQMFELEKLSKNYSSDDLTIISIDVWVVYGEDANLLEEYITYLTEEFDLDISWVFGLDDSNGTIFYQHASGGVPTIYILDKNGNIYYSHVGYIDYSTLSSKIEELLV